MITKDKQEMVSFPISIFESAETKEELEDWLMCQDPEFIESLRKARQEHLRGEGTDWETIKKELCLK
ncbi:MAG: hypothetical protein HQK91_13460 [Nitrospirae bacterium]|nr:hypothetical protein [Nitrospirota bacterium]